MEYCVLIILQQFMCNEDLSTYYSNYMNKENDSYGNILAACMLTCDRALKLP